MKGNMKKLLLAVLAIGVLGAGYGYYLWTKKPENLLDVKTAATFEASSIMDEFKKDPVGAGTRYNGKPIQVSGEIAEITKNDAGDLTVLLNTTTGGKVICEFDRMYKVEDTGYKTGDKINLKGECTGFDDLFGDVKLSRCQPVK
jgi:hypothetical protein